LALLTSPQPARAHAHGKDAPGVVVRRWTPGDGVGQVTALLHRAYAKQVGMGLRPLAGRQDEQVTLRRLSSGECYIAVCVPGAGTLSAEAGEQIVGVIILAEKEPDEGPPFFMRAGVLAFSQFAVDPWLQGAGVGGKLLGTVEARAVELGSTELALSMAEPDHGLRDYYLRRGYRVVGVWKWPYTNYNSLVLSKRLVGGEGGC